MSIERNVVRTYALPIREVREAIIAYLKAKNMPTPSYVGDTSDTKWSATQDGGIRVEWTEKDEM